MPEASDNYFDYTGERGREVSFVLGGIGAGSVGLSAGGRLIDWEIANRPNKGSVNGFSHFAIRAERAGEVVDTRVLHGPFHGNLSGDLTHEPFRSFGFGAQREYLTGLPNFSHCRFEGTFPTARLQFREPKFPGAVDLLAFSPFIPHDSDNSSLPTAMFEYSIVNNTDGPLDYTLLGTITNPARSPHRVYHLADAHAHALVQSSALEVAETPEYGEVALLTDAEDVSWQRHWHRGAWFDELEVYWQDASAPGPLTDRFYDSAGATRSGRDHSTLAARVTVEPGQQRTVRFAIAWYFPHCSKYWVSKNAIKEGASCGGQVDGGVKDIWRNYYATRWEGAAAVGKHVFANWASLSERTLAFTRALHHMTLPLPVRDAISANISVLKTPTALRLEDGTFYGWEGCHTQAGCCEGSCTHVWSYQQALPFLFPDLERTLRRCELDFCQDKATGGMSFRLALPLGVGISNDRPCADGQFACVLKFYRDWKISGDTDWLRANWDGIRQAIEYAWHPDNEDRWDPDRTGVLWGRQHHTLDMELFGPNAWLTGFYLGGLLAGAEIADAVGDPDAAATYREIAAKGRAWCEEHLFNGRYFTQAVDLDDKSVLAPYEDGQASSFLTHGFYDLYWSEEHGQLKCQVGDGCLLDQMLAQWHADLYGLGDLFDRDKVRSAIDSVFEHNHLEQLSDIANPCRIYGLGNEAGTMICSWPEGANRPAIPIPYAQETMHGFEYAFGCSLFLNDRLEAGTKVFRAVRDRYRGHNRNPWNEIECGSNYARSMASYAALPALSGFSFDMVQRRLGFAPKVQQDGTFLAPWSVAEAWGEIEIVDGRAALSVEFGALHLSRLAIGAGADVAVTLDGEPHAAAFHGDTGDIDLGDLTVAAGSTLTIVSNDIRVSGLTEAASL